jgi:hypothetical protein
MTNKPNFHLLPFNELLEIIGWSKTTAAHKMKIQKRTLMRWAADHDLKYPAPRIVREWVEELAEYHWFHPHPVGWEKEDAGDD